MTTNTSNDAYNQASAQIDSIVAMVNALQCDYETMQDLQDIKDSLCTGESLLPADSAQLDELLAEANGCIDSEDALTHIMEDALSVEVRSDWTVAGGALEATEFAILLCTGGPAVRIRGELSEHGEPTRAWLEYQDWGTPWMEYHGDNADQQFVLAYANCFILPNQPITGVRVMPIIDSRRELVQAADLTGSALDYAVAMCEGKRLSGASLAYQIQEHGTVTDGFKRYSPSSDWEIGGPIIELARVRVTPFPPGREADGWSAGIYGKEMGVAGPTPLIAAMRCYVASKFQNGIDIPEELLK